MKRSKNELVIYCDFCPSNDFYSEGSYRNNMAKARQNGWHFLKAGDVCNTCFLAKKHKTKAKQND